MSSKTKSNNSNSSDLCTKVPDNLKRLLRHVLKSFYNFELYLVMEMLVIYPCIKEEDLAEVLKLDLKVVRQYLINLKQEKFISEKSTIETSADAKQQKKTYYYINYKMTVNVIKFKLDKIRLQIEQEEKQCTSRASFKCTQCSKTYSDLDMNEMLLMTMRCTHCGGLVDEDSSNIQNRAARNLLVKFNTQMELIYRLLHEVENIQFAPNILSPAPADYSEIIQSLNTSPSAPVNSTDMSKKSASNSSKGQTMWSGEASRFVQVTTKTEINFIESNLNTLDVHSLNNGSQSLNDENLQDFRQEEITANNDLSSIIDSRVRIKNGIKQDTFQSLISSQTQHQQQQQQEHQEDPERRNLDENILKLLLIHENKNKNDASLAKQANTLTNTSSSTLKKRDSNHLNNDIEQLMSHGFGHELNPKKRRLNGYYSDMDIENTNYYHTSSNGLTHEYTKVNYHLYDQNSMDIDDNSLYSNPHAPTHHNRFNSTDSNNNDYTSDTNSLIENDIVHVDVDDDNFHIKVGTQSLTIDKVSTDLIRKIQQRKDAYVEKS